MRTANQLFVELQNYERKHRKLKQLFIESARRVAEVLGNRDLQIPGVAITLELDHCRFTASFCDLTVVVKFRSWIDAAGVATGKIEFFRSPGFTEEGLSLIGSVNFNSIGETDYPDPSSDDSPDVVSGGFHFLLHFLMLALCGGDSTESREP